MQKKPISDTSWSTAAFGDEIQKSSPELSALGAHLDMCKGSGGHLLALHCAATRMHGFVATRFMTTLVVIVGLIIGAASLVL